MRLFIAVCLPPDLHAPLAAAQDRLRAAGGRVRWVAPENFHFTLKFLGEVAESRVQEVRAALANLPGRQAPFDLALRGVGAFPTPRRPRVIWAGAAHGATALVRLAAEVEEALAGLHLPREQRPFAAHLTLGRVQEATPALADRLAADADTDFGAVQVAELQLMRSVLHPGGPEYSAVARYPLEGGPEER